MINESDTPPDYEDYEDFEPAMQFHERMQLALTPRIKQFLADYYGESFYNLQPETYLRIDQTITDAFLFATQIPDILFNHLTIKDSDKFDEALANFTLPTTARVWKNYHNWFDRDFEDDLDDDTEDTFLEDSNPIDLTPAQQKAKQIIDQANILIESTQNFANYMKTGYEILLKEARLFLENTSSFDLSILSPEGFDALHQQIDSLLNVLLEQLDITINSQQ